MLIDLKITEYLDKAAEGTAVPGGGSVAALNAALAAGLSEMVAHLTIGKKGYESSDAEMRDILHKAAALRTKLTSAIDRDAEAYSEVLAAFKLPQATDEAKKLRNRKIQEAFKQAALVPLEVARDAVEVMDLAGKAIKSGNRNMVTDGAVAVMNARTAVLAALYNVKINLTSIKDDEFVQTIAREVTKLEQQALDKERDGLSHVAV